MESLTPSASRSLARARSTPAPVAQEQRTASRRATASASHLILPSLCVPTKTTGLLLPYATAATAARVKDLPSASENTATAASLAAICCVTSASAAWSQHQSTSVTLRGPRQPPRQEERVSAGAAPSVGA